MQSHLNHELESAVDGVEIRGESRKFLKQEKKDRVVHPPKSTGKSVSRYWQLTKRDGG